MENVCRRRFRLDAVSTPVVARLHGCDREDKTCPMIAESTRTRPVGKKCHSLVFKTLTLRTVPFS